MNSTSKLAQWRDLRRSGRTESWQSRNKRSIEYVSASIPLEPSLSCPKLPSTHSLLVTAPVESVRQEVEGVASSLVLLAGC